MRFRKVLLVSPYAPRRYFGGIRPPVGIGYIGEFLASNGIEVDALDMTAGLDLRDLLRRVREFRPQLVGFTVMTYQYRHTLDMIRRVKRVVPSVQVVVGGPHVCALEGALVRQHPVIDFAVAGEGEYPMRDLCTGVPLERIHGLYYRLNGGTGSGPPKRVVEDLDTLPFPRFRQYPFEKYTDEIEIITSRGCPHRCIFCAVGNIMGGRLRYRSAGSVADELEHWYNLGRRRFQIGDDNFLADRARVIRVVKEIEARGLKGLLLRCGQGIRADLLDRELLLVLKRIGFKHLGIGVESANDRVLATLRKGATALEIERSIALACELGFDVSLFFVVGAPGETLRDVEASMHLAWKYAIMKAFFFNLIPFPGTDLYKWVETNDAFLAPYEDLINRGDELKLRSKPFFATAEMPEADRVHALRITEKLSKMIQVRTLRRKLAPLGPLRHLLCQIGRFDFLEKWFIGNRSLRRLTDRLIFGNGSSER